MASGTSSPTFWQKTKSASGNAYRSTLKPSFDKAYDYVDKLGDPVNRLSNKVGAEAFWPTTLDKESVKAARIIRSFCKDGFYDNIEEKPPQDDFETPPQSGKKFENKPQGTQRTLKKIPAKVIKNAKALAIYTTMRTGWVLGGSGGAGVMIARHPETGEWGAPSGIMTHNMSVGFLAGADIMDMVLVINDDKALDAFTRLRVRLGTEIAVVAGPVGVGGSVDGETTTRAPVWSYVRSRGLYGGVALEGNLVLERSDENERFYGYKLSNQEIFAGKVRHPPIDKYQILLDTLKAAEGQAIDENLLPSDGMVPSDMEVDWDGSSFGIPDQDDPDPYGVKALEAEGMVIREAGSKQRPSAEVFEFRPAPSSPVYGHSTKGSISKRSTWRASTASVNSVDRATQTDDDAPRSVHHSPVLDSPRQMSPPRKVAASVDDAEMFHEVNMDDDKKSPALERRNSFSDDESDVEIHTAVSIPAKPRIVSVQKKPPPPALPPRNPERAPAQSMATPDEEKGEAEFTRLGEGVPGSFH